MGLKVYEATAEEVAELAAAGGLSPTFTIMASIQIDNQLEFRLAILADVANPQRPQRLLVLGAELHEVLRPEIMRSNWEWAGRYALFWIIVTLFIFGAIFAVLDYGDASESVRIQSFVLLATINFAQRDLAGSRRFGCSYRIDVEASDNPPVVSRPE
jgi:hypothetical protein